MGHDVIAMEQYVAEGAWPLDRCMADVANADVYVLVLAWRYGYTVPPDDPDGKSITELEYQHAVQHKKPVLAFLLNPDTPWPPGAMDSMSVNQAAATGIAELRGEV